jgi:hypothetical protein
MEYLLHSLFKEPYFAGCYFHTTPARGILSHGANVKLEKAGQLLWGDGTAHQIFEFVGIHSRFRVHKYKKPDLSTWPLSSNDLCPIAVLSVTDNELSV